MVDVLSDGNMRFYMHRLSGHGHTGAGQQAQHHLSCKKHNNFLTFLLISAVNFVDGPYCIPVIHLTDIIFYPLYPLRECA